mmetsp:Transcript_33576/g.57579  ORF Transcript_33576/g.57579 Transcript_33576/m.57579 type:complete len:680 (+) Transcript_33576:271-2310(+)
MELSVLRVVTTHKARSWGGSLALHLLQLLLLRNAWSRMPRTGQLQALVGGARVGARRRGEERRALSVWRVVAQIVEVAWRQSGLGVLGRRGVPSVQRSLLLLLLLLVMRWLLVVHRRLKVQALRVDPALRCVVLLRRVPRRLRALLRVLLLVLLLVLAVVITLGVAVVLLVATHVAAAEALVVVVVTPSGVIVVVIVVVAIASRSAAAVGLALLVVAAAAVVVAGVMVVQVRKPLRHFLSVLLQESQDLRRNLAIALAELASWHKQRRGHAAHARTTGTSNAVHIHIEVLRTQGQIELDHMRHRGHVESTRGDVRGNEDADLSVAELPQGVLALGLGAVAVDLLGLDVALAAKAIAQPGGRAALLHKHQRAAFGLVDRPQQELNLVVRIGRGAEDLLFDVVYGGAHATNADPHVVAQELTGQGLDLVGESGGEEKSLALAGGRHVVLLDDAADLGLETHVKHAIGLVQHQQGHTAEGHTATVHQVVQTAGGGHDQITARGQLSQLGAQVVATVHTYGLEVRAVHQAPRVEVDLRGQLTGGRQHHSQGQGTTLADAHALHEVKRRGGVGSLLDALLRELLLLGVEAVAFVGSAARICEAITGRGHFLGGQGGSHTHHTVAIHGSHHGQHEREGLARSRLSATHQVNTSQTQGHGMFLNGRRVDVLHQLDILRNIRGNLAF